MAKNKTTATGVSVTIKNALITGASEGIGNALAKRLAIEGYSITAVARNEDKLKQLISDIGNSHSFITADLTTESGQLKVTQAIADTKFDLLINNAGVGAVGRFTDLPLNTYSMVIALNIEAVVKLSYAFLKTAKQGDILVNISSSLAFMPIPILGVYSATKAFVTSFSESLWQEQKSRGVYVLGFCPGITSTNFNAHSGGGQTEMPGFMTQTPEQVVDEVIKALKLRKKPTVSSGTVNKAFAFMTRFMSRKANVSMMGKMVPK